MVNAVWIDYDGGIFVIIICMMMVVGQALKDTGLWADTLFVFTSDNGGISKGNNYPLRGQDIADS